MASSNEPVSEENVIDSIAKQDEDENTILEKIAIAEGKRDKMQQRLDAEGSLGIICALIGGFALSMVTTVESIESASNYFRWIFVLCMCVSGASCLFVVLITGHLYWAGSHILSASMKRKKLTQNPITSDCYNEVDVFRLFWKQKNMKLARKYCRMLLGIAIPLFLTGICALVQHQLDNIALTVTVGIIFVSFQVFCFYLQHSVTSFVQKVTATS